MGAWKTRNHWNSYWIDAWNRESNRYADITRREDKRHTCEDFVILAIIRFARHNFLPPLFSYKIRSYENE